MSSVGLPFEERPLQSGTVRLHLRVTPFAEPPRAEVLLTHGLGEHAGRYGHVAAVLAEHGLRLWGYDVRGHGRSEGPRGDARYEDLLSDLGRVHQEVARSGRPLFFLGHSMGAQITLSYLLSRPVECRGAVIASPWLRLAFEPPRWRRALAQLASWLAPAFTQPTASILGKLSRDVEHIASLAEPELVHHRVSARLFLALQRAGRQALVQAPGFRLPILLVHGGSDEVTSCAATREFYERAGSADKRFILYPEALHETHNDVGREQMLEECARWMSQRVDAPPGESSTVPAVRVAEAR